MKPELFILTGAVHTGKTTALMEWCVSQQTRGRTVRGLLNPLREGRKVFHDVYHRAVFPMEVDAHRGEEVITIGKYTFLKSAFERAKEIITREGQLDADVFILDEIGKLELKGEGLEPAVSRMLASTGDMRCSKLVLVVRDYLLEEAITRYGLGGARVLGVEGVGGL